MLTALRGHGASLTPNRGIPVLRQMSTARTAAGRYKIPSRQRMFNRIYRLFQEPTTSESMMGLIDAEFQKQRQFQWAQKTKNPNPPAGLASKACSPVKLQPPKFDGHFTLNAITASRLSRGRKGSKISQTGTNVMFSLRTWTDLDHTRPSATT